MNIPDFFPNTTVGKSTKTFAWVLLANVVVYILTSVINRPDLFNPLVVGGANVVLVLVKNVFDPKIKNV